MIVLDTNTLIQFFQGAGKVAERLLATPPSEVAVPSIVLYEIEIGVLRSRNPSARRLQLDELLSRVSILPFGMPEAAASAQIRVDLEQAGLPIGPHDTLIAGTALAHGATLATRNVREFSRVEGLRVINWFD
jgi:tRNA(fMet)-specific endonuclease VapC